MASERQLRQLRAALAHDEADERALVESFLEHKVLVYIDTLGDLADAYGYAIEDDEIVLSDDVIRALRDESRAHAKSVVATFNRELEQLLDRNAEKDRDDLLDLYETWAEQRADSRTTAIALTEAYSAHADATAAFFQAAGLEAEPAFDFGGHPELGDSPPACAVCQALVDTNPHPLSRVLEVGTPHIQCAQEWHERDVDPDTMPDEIHLGAAVAGIVGRDALVNRAGNDHEAAAAMIRDLATPDDQE